MIYNYHPVSLFCYFTAILIFTMFFNTPIFLVFSATGSILLYLSLSKYKISIKSLLWNLVFILLISISNPLFNHNGTIALFYINNNAITLEAILYGLNLGIMLISVLYWFKSINIIMTQDKILYLFGKLSPKLAMIISNSLRFIPMLKEQAKKVRNAQTVMGFYSDDNYLNRLKSSVRAFSSVMNYGFEKAIGMGMSMDAKGYGLNKRTYYSSFSFRSKDLLSLIFTIIVCFTIALAKINGYLEFNFYPSISHSGANSVSIISNIVFALFCIMPYITNSLEGLKWKYYRSKI